MKYNSNSMVAKKYIKSIYSKSKLENLFSEICFTKTEYDIMIMHFIDSMTICMISSKLMLSDSTIKRYLKNTLTKIYKYLIDTNSI